MQYQSTRNRKLNISSAEAIVTGLSPDGGLFLPAQIPVLSSGDFEKLANNSYTERAAQVLAMYLTDFSAEEIGQCVNAAYASGRFSHPAVAPLRTFSNNAALLELWHGPTCAFKDMALQILPHLMRVSVQKTSGQEKIVILVATSGDTGKAALEGFCDAPDTEIIVFYPGEGVSAIQKRQMTTQQGNNVYVAGINGNFDDAQTGVKRMFTDKAVLERLKEENKRFSSANSINFGRLAPQIVYYLSAYCDWVNSGRIAFGEAVNIVVPTGNFGNILAAYYAKHMGMPVNKLICASNTNRVLTDFIQTGVYDRNRDFHVTSSPSMDILISSNLERLLFLLCGRNDGEIKGYMQDLAETGRYTVSDDVKIKLQHEFAAGSGNEELTRKTIADTFEKTGILLDPHTAVGVGVYNEYKAETGDNTPTIIAATANPFKFAAAILPALGKACDGIDEFEQLKQLAAITGWEIPPQLEKLKDLPERFTAVYAREELAQTVLSALK